METQGLCIPMYIYPNLLLLQKNYRLEGGTKSHNFSITGLLLTG